MRNCAVSLNAYTIRMFEPSDRTEWLELFAHVHNTSPSPEWFDWKYEANPFAPRTPIIVAEHDGQIVGTRPLLAMPIRAGEWQDIAFEHGDAMVHPDHRRQGLFSAMVERAVEEYRAAGAPFIFSFPNEKSGAAYRKLGWPVVGTVAEAYRFHHPGTVLANRLEVSLPRWLERALDRSHRVVDGSRAVVQPLPAGVQTEVMDEIPIPALRELYLSNIPQQLHAERTVEFLHWRFANPNWNYMTFIGRIDGEAIAALIVGYRREQAGTHIVRITDVLPVDETWRRNLVLEVLIGDVVSAFEDSDLFVIPSTVIPESIRRRWGFIDKKRWPLDRVTLETTLVVKPLAELPSTVVPTALDGWKPTFVEYDTA